MKRTDFLQELASSLVGELPQHIINEHVNFYENYIIEESRKGRTEEEVLETLGNPRLIGKTILDTNHLAEEEQQYTTANQEGGEDDLANKKGFRVEARENGGFDFYYGKFKFNSWYGKGIFLVLLLLILVLLARLFIALVPIFVVIFVVFFLITLITGRR